MNFHKFMALTKTDKSLREIIEDTIAIQKTFLDREAHSAFAPNTSQDEAYFNRTYGSIPPHNKAVPLLKRLTAPKSSISFREASSISLEIIAEAITSFFNVGENGEKQYFNIIAGLNEEEIAKRVEYIGAFMLLSAKLNLELQGISEAMVYNWENISRAIIADKVNSTHQGYDILQRLRKYALENKSTQSIDMKKVASDLKTNRLFEDADLLIPISRLAAIGYPVSSGVTDALEYKIKQESVRKRYPLLVILGYGFGIITGDKASKALGTLEMKEVLAMRRTYHQTLGVLGYRLEGIAKVSLSQRRWRPYHFAELLLQPISHEPELINFEFKNKFESALNLVKDDILRTDDPESCRRLYFDFAEGIKYAFSTFSGFKYNYDEVLNKLIYNARGLTPMGEDIPPQQFGLLNELNNSIKSLLEIAAANRQELGINPRLIGHVKHLARVDIGQFKKHHPALDYCKIFGIDYRAVEPQAARPRSGR